jgi:hypothetical protein
MKKSILVFGLLLCGFIYGQNNQSDGLVPTSGITPASTTIDNEIYRFKGGAVTGLQDPLGDFNFFPGSIWFTLGQVEVDPNFAPGAPDFYGSRFQYDERALVQGYAINNNVVSAPRIQWIHNGGSTADFLEFRVGNGFGGSGGPGQNTLVASMSPLSANTYFGTGIDVSNPFGDNILTSPKVGISTAGQLGLSIKNFGTDPFEPTLGAKIEVRHTTEVGYGLQSECSDGENSFAILGTANGAGRSFGVRGETIGNASFGAAIYGRAAVTGSSNFAGFFEGDVFTTTTYFPSDENLKNNIEDEKNALERISLLRPVTYNFIETSDINLPKVNQHGFVSQEMAEVFPELTKDITKPIFDEDGEIVSDLSFKGINYVALIPILTAGIQELNTELSAVREELAEYKANDKIRESLVQDSREVSDYTMEQNIPNPFNDRSVIRYQLAPDVKQASITIFNLNGGFVKDYPINENKGEITILASEIGKGMFIYSLTRNGQEITSKRMIVR